MKSFFRKDIEAMSGYVPGEQPHEKNVVKLNTNENPFPPSPRIKKYLSELDIGKLRLYPDPLSCEIRTIIAAKFAMNMENVIVGNGSDDLLNMIIRACTNDKRTMACFEPSYSLYPVLAQIQGTKCLKIPLKKDFSMPLQIQREALDAALFIIARPNAPTGNSFSKRRIEELCETVAGIVLVDEAYVDFAEDNCAELVNKYENIVVCRTLSKSYSLAGIRFGFAMASEKIISQMMKVKDSYNVNRITQEIAKIAILDEKHFQKNLERIKENRQFLTESLRHQGFVLENSQANFVFASPPPNYPNAQELYLHLKQNGVFVRHFPGEKTKNHIRISIGTKEEIKKMLSFLANF